MNSNISLEKSDEELFLQIAPRSAWAKYNCFALNSTFNSVSKNLLLNQKEYLAFSTRHQLDLAKAALNIVRKNPLILLDRQVCISKILWQIEYGQIAFQATAILGHDNVRKEFDAIAGESRSLLPDLVGVNIQKYVTWSENHTIFWFFWKPALPLLIGLFCVFVRLTVKRDIGLLVVTVIPLSLILVMTIIIPFPEYRYVYPAVLFMMLLCSFAFANNNQPFTVLSSSVLVESGRIFWIDACRIFAIFGVILIHACGLLFYKYGDISIKSWLTVNLIDSLVRASVPIFVMISGALLLRSSDNNLIKPVNIALRIGKVLFPLIFWSIFYLWWIDYTKGDKVIIPEEWFGKLHKEPVMYHLWFAYMIIGIYILMPVLQIVFNACKTNRRFALYFFGIWLSTNFLSAYTAPPFINSLQIGAVFGYGGYFILGGFLNNLRSINGGSLKWWVIYGCGVVVTFVVTWARTSSSGIPDELAYSYFSPNVFAASISVFMLLKSMPKPNGAVIKIVQWISDSCFFIFFVHVVVLDLLSVGAIELNILMGDVHPVIYIPLLALATFLFSLALSALARVIPGSRRILG